VSHERVFTPFLGIQVLSLLIILHPFMGCKFCLYSLFYTLSWDTSFVFTHYFTPFHGMQVLSLLIILHPFMGRKFCLYSLFYTLSWDASFVVTHYFTPFKRQNLHPMKGCKIMRKDKTCVP
jgi:hypothetical protein